jgi:SAM-dependent methyltransferase
MREWVAFWNSENSIYVNDRHRKAHYRTLAADVRPYIEPGASVLDYGCGEALEAASIAAIAGRLVLSDAAPNVRAALAGRYGSVNNVEVRTPEEVEALPAGSFDLIVMISVAQYLSSDELDGLLGLFRRLLRPGGRLLLGDVVPPSVSPVTDVVALLRFAAANGFLVAAFAGLIRTAFSDYRKLRSRIGLAFHDERAILARLAAAGFNARRADNNVGHNSARMSFIATAAD